MISARRFRHLAILQKVMVEVESPRIRIRRIINNKTFKIMRLSNIFNLFIILMLAGALAACDSSTSSSVDEDPPEPMEFSDIQMDLEIFQQAGRTVPEFDAKNMAADIAEYLGEGTQAEQMSPYEFAGMMAVAADGIFQSYGMLPNIYFNEDMWGDPELDGNTWVWEFSETIEGESFTIRVTAEETGDIVNWELRYSFSSPDEPDVDNALLMSAEIREDGTSGTWALYSFFEETGENNPELEFEFVIEGDITTLLEMRIMEDVSGNFENLLYEVVEEIASLSFLMGEVPFTYIEWNRDTWAGFIESDDYNNGIRSCWDSNLQTTEC